MSQTFFNGYERSQIGSLLAENTAGACVTNMLWPSGLMRAGQPGQITRIALSHCSSLAENRRSREYSTEPI